MEFSGQRRSDPLTLGHLSWPIMISPDSNPLFSSPPEPRASPTAVQVGQLLISPHHGQGRISRVSGQRIFVQYRSHEVSYPSWERALGVGLEPMGLQVEDLDRLDEQLAQISDPQFQQVAQELRDRIALVEQIPATPAQYSPLPTELHPAVTQALQSLGFGQLYSHQVESFNRLSQGKDLILATPTASGKTLCYTPAVLSYCLDHPQATSLYLFPLKALAMDQMDKLTQIVATLETPLKIGLLTGDTPQPQRQDLFTPSYPQILCMNPDLLHFQLLRTRYHTHAHEQWRAFLKNLKYVVVDEAHTYRSILGAHFANLMRRLRLAVDRQGGESHQIQFILSSATIGNPRDLALKFSGRSEEPDRLHLIDTSGSAQAGRTQICLYPSSQPNPEAADIVISWLMKGLSGIVFLNSRSATKDLLRQIQERLQKLNQLFLSRKVAIFYGSLQENRRRELMDRLRQGQLQVILSTSALEAGIDIPALDCCLLRGYPGSIMSFRQRLGRAGRARAALVIYLPVAQNPLDHFFGQNPHLLLQGPPEHVVCNPDYRIVLASHLLCGCKESGLQPQEVESHFGPMARSQVDELRRQHQIDLEQGWWLTRGSPHREINIRGNRQDTFALINQKTGQEFEQISRDIAYREVYPGAIYTSQSESGQITFYISRELNLTTRQGILAPLPQDPKRRTRAQIAHGVDLLELMEDPKLLSTRIPAGRIRLTLGWGRISTMVDGFQKVSSEYQDTCTHHRCEKYHKPLRAGRCPACGRRTRVTEITHILETETFPKPYHTDFEAPVLRLEINEPIRQLAHQLAQELKQNLQVAQDPNPLETAAASHRQPERILLHSAAHQICLASPLLVLGSLQDLNCVVVTDRSRTQTIQSMVYFYDAYQGGSGLCEELFRRFPEFVYRANQMVNACDCRCGCPRCLTYYGCPQQNEELLKQMGSSLLGAFGDQTSV